MGDTVRIRGWLIVGGIEASKNLPPGMKMNMTYRSFVPDVMSFEPGIWFIWQPVGTPAMTMVCVEID